MHVKRRPLARIVRATDAPKALKGRTARRAWASEYNRVARATGDQEAARKAGAELAMAAIDCDAGIAAHVKKGRKARASNNRRRTHFRWPPSGGTGTSTES